MRHLHRSFFPWFYFVFFMAMMAHRVKRDIDRSRRKYGEAYKRYEKEVPYLFIPVLHTEPSRSCLEILIHWLTNSSLVYLLSSRLHNIL